MSGANVTRIFFPCTGLGRQQRGFESFTRGCAAALRGDTRLDITVFGGGGPFAAAGERAVPNFPRDGAASKLIGALARRDPYFVEQASFFAGLLPSLVRGRPDLVYFADLNLGNACWHWRRISGQRFRLLFYNGGRTTQPFTRCDFVQQVSPEHLESALARGEASGRQMLLPHALDVAAAFSPVSQSERDGLRTEFRLPANRPVVVSVGAINGSVKRMDYLVREVAAMGTARPFLLIAGAHTSETPAVLRLAGELLGAAGYSARVFRAEEMQSVYRACDAFALASLHEGFGLAIVEALTAGLPCVVHDTPTSAYITGTHALRGDLRAAGAMAPLLQAAIAGARDESAMRERHAWVHERFSWDALRERYSEMLRACGAGHLPGWAAASA